MKLRSVRGSTTLLLCLSALLPVTPLRSQNQPTLHSADMDERFGKPYVMVTINGRGPYRFVIDTGTGADALVTPELAGELALPVVGQATLSDPSGQGGKKVRILQIGSLSLAGVEFANIHAVEHTFYAEAGAVQGLLGFTLFRNLLLTLDFPNHRVTLDTGSLAPDGEKTVLPFRLQAGVPVARLKIGGLEPVEAQLDSGGGGLVLPQQLAARLKYDVSPIPFASGQSICTKFQIMAGKLGSDVKIGRYTITHPVVEIHPAFPLVNFGSPPMQMFAITFDQKNLLVRFAASQKRFTLTAPPTPPRLANEAAHQPTPPGLVPVG